MATAANPLSELGSVTVDTAARLSRISFDSAERVFALQLDFAKTSLDQAAKTARALAGAKDVQEFIAARTHGTEGVVERLVGYSRSLYEISSEAQTQLSRLAEERMSTFQKAVTESVDQAVKSAPAGGDVAAAAIKSSLAATTAAYDSFTKAAKSVTSYADASVRAAGRSKKGK